MRTSGKRRGPASTTKMARNSKPARGTANYAWSAAFISYVMRTAGARAARFPYCGIAHATYIDIGKEMKTGAAAGVGAW